MQIKTNNSSDSKHTTCIQTNKTTLQNSNKTEEMEEIALLGKTSVNAKPTISWTKR